MRALLILLLVLTFAVRSAAAGDVDVDVDTLTDADRAWLERSKAILDNPSAHADPAIAEAARTPLSPDDRDAARKILDQAGEHASAARSTVGDAATRAPVDRPPGPYTRLYVSQAMGDETLRTAVELARRDPTLVLVLRGYTREQGMRGLQQKLVELLDPKHNATLPTIEIDPPQFRADQVTRVPTLVRYENERAIARVAGLVNPAWLARQVAGGAQGDLGQQGPVVAISEIDLLAEIEARIAAKPVTVDPERAQRDFWAAQSFFNFPVATERRERLVDPTFVVTEPIKAQDGTLIAFTGQRVNPLDHAPFTQRLVVFDATSAAQSRVAARLTREAGTRRVTLLSSRFEREHGFEGVETTSESFGRPVFLITRDVIERFGIQRIPATVEARGNRFVVTEYPVEE